MNLRAHWKLRSLAPLLRFSLIATAWGVLFLTGCNSFIEKGFLGMGSISVQDLSDDSVATTSKTWTWSCSGAPPCQYRYAISPSSTWSPTGDFSSTPSASISGGDGLYYLHVQARDSEGNLSEVKTVSVLLDNTAPTIDSILVQSSQAVDVTFNEAMGSSALNASNYSLSGSGKGSLLATPDSVSWVSGGTYRLHWNSGLMLIGGDIILSASGAQDLASNTVIANTLTQSGGGMGTAPTLTGIASDSTATTAKSWSWSCSETCLYRYAINSSSSWSPTGAFTSSASASISSGDGTFYLHVQAQDSAGNLSSVNSVSFVLDTTTPSLTGLSTDTTPTSSKTWTWGCSEASCNYRSTIDQSPTTTPTGAFSSTTTLTHSSGTGTFYLHLQAQDSAGNVSATTHVSAVIDNTAPAITISPLGSFQGNTATGALSFSLTEAHVGTGTSLSIELNPGSGWSSLGTLPATAGANTGTAYSFTGWTVPLADTAAAQIRISYTDQAGNSTTETSAPFTIDSTPPQLSATVLSSGQATTSNASVPIALSATDSLSPIHSVCIKTHATAPSASDACWSSLVSFGITPAASLSSIPLFYNLGVASGTYTLYFWLKDSVGNASSLSASGVGTSGTDRGSIIFDPPSAPTISLAQSSSDDSPAHPLGTGDKSVSVGGSVYLKWSASSTSGIPATGISIEYTTDDVNFSTLISGLSNSANTGACTLNGSFTGCAVLTAPSSGYFRLRVRAQDIHNYAAYGAANGMNTGSLNFLAGNTDLALGASAKSAILLPCDQCGLAVLNDGRIFLGDSRGLGWQNPATGAYEILIPNTGTSSGDGGPVTSATLNRLSKVAVDFAGNLLILDDVKLRKLTTSTSPMTIQAFIGGGFDTSDSISNPLLLQLPNTAIFFPLPNGDIWFDLHSSKLKKYTSSTGQITSLQMAGTGNSYSASHDLMACVHSAIFPILGSSGALQQMGWRMFFGGLSSACAYTNEWREEFAYAAISPETGLSELPAPGYINSAFPAIAGAGGYREFHTFHLGRNLKTYAIGFDSWVFGLGPAGLLEYQSSSRSWTRVMGTGGSGTCADLTLASDCNITPGDISVNSLGQIFFVDKKAKSVRTIANDGRIQTLMGDALGSTDNTTALQARFSGLTDLKYWSDSGTDRFVILDFQDSRIREFTESGGLSTLAGAQYSAVPAAGSVANTQPILTVTDETTTRFQLSASGDVYFRLDAPEIARRSRSTGLWENLIGIGNTYAPKLMGLYGNSLLLRGGNQWWDKADGWIQNLNLSTTVLSSVVSGSAFSPDFCADGTALNACNIRWNGDYGAQAIYDTVLNQWLTVENGNSARIVRFNGDGSGTMETLVTLPRQIHSFDVKRSSDLSTNRVYYCATDHQLYRYDLNTSTETHLAFSVPGMLCHDTVRYVESRDALLFIYWLNGLDGVAEFVNP
ncbi:MAG: hypothetical protein RJB38_955 [Pseudomonadota bacterium]|jgi:hypothetical protein